MRQVQGKEFQEGVFSFLEPSIIKIAEVHINEIQSPQHVFKKIYLLILTAWSGEHIFSWVLFVHFVFSPFYSFSNSTPWGN